MSQTQIVDLTSDSDSDSDIEVVGPPSPRRPDFKGLKTKPSRSWFYTLNNYTEAQKRKFENLDCLVHICGNETGDSGTPHLQGCVTFKTPKRFAAMKRIEPRAHWEIPLNIEAARNYCLKDNDAFIRDNRKQGARTDLKLACDMLKEGKPMRDVVDAFPDTYVKFHNGLLNFSTYQKQVPRTDPPEVYWFFGPTGTGKTAAVHAMAGGAPLWISDGGLEYFNGYTDQKLVLFDDFRGDSRHFAKILRLFDRYPISVNVKHGHREWNPTKIFVTTPFAPADSYPGLSEDLGQLVRRITYIVEFATPVAESEPFSLSGLNVTFHKGEPFNFSFI